MSVTRVDRTSSPEPRSPRPYRFPSIRRETLGNGLRVRIATARHAPLVSVRLVVRGGADHDPIDRAGLASLTAGMLDEGAGERDALGVAAAVGRIGAFLGTGADWDSSWTWLDALTTHLEEGLDVFSDVVMRPRFDEGELERVRNDRLTAILQQRDDPATVAALRFSALVFEGSRYGAPMNGTEETVGRISRDDVISFWSRHMVPSRSSLIVAGDIDPDRALQVVRDRFEEWSGADCGADASIVGVDGDSPMLRIIDRPQSVQSEIRVGHVGLPRSSDDYFPVVVMNSILGEIFNSRIMLNLRERHGYTYGARSSFAFRRNAGPFVVSTAVRNEVTAEAIREILGELERIRSGDVTTAELDASKNYLMGVFPATVQTVNDLASRIQEMELYGLADDYFDRYRERIGEVTVDDVTRVARARVHPERARIVVVGSAEAIRKPLESLEVPMSVHDLDGRPVAEVQLPGNA